MALSLLLCLKNKYAVLSQRIYKSLLMLLILLFTAANLFAKAEYRIQNWPNHSCKHKRSCKPVINSTPPNDICRFGEIVLNNRVQPQFKHFHPKALKFDFNAEKTGPICITVAGVTQSHFYAGSFRGGYFAQKPWISLDGGYPVISSHRLNDKHVFVEQPLVAQAGSHSLYVMPNSSPQSYLDVTIRIGQTDDTQLWPDDYNRSRHLALFDLNANQIDISNTGGSDILSVQGSVYLPESSHHNFWRKNNENKHSQQKIIWEFNIVDPSTCEEIQTFKGEELANKSKPFSASVGWDSRDKQGNILNGEYLFRARAKLIEIGRHGERIIDKLKTAYEKITIDNQRPTINVALPVNESIVTTNEIDIIGSWQDPEVNEFASGLNIATAQILLDGIDVAGVLQEFDINGFAGTITNISDGVHALEVRIADQFANQTNVITNFTVDTKAPIVVWMQPDAIAGDIDVLLEISFSDNASGIKYGSIEAFANDLSLTGVFSCSPHGVDGELNIICKGSYPLDEGVWHLNAKVSDMAGNITAATTQIVVDRSPPIISLDPNPDGSIVNAVVIPIIGKVSDNTAVTIKVNGNNIGLMGNAFSTQAALNIGANVINIEATDALGHVSTKTIAVTRKLDGPEVTHLSLNGVLMPCQNPATDPAVIVSTTMSPLLKVNYQDTAAGVFGDGVTVDVDELDIACGSAENNERAHGI